MVESEVTRPGVPNLENMYPRVYIFLSEGVHKNILTYYFFPNIYTYINEYYFQKSVYAYY